MIERLKTHKEKVMALMVKNNRYKDDCKFLISGYYWNYCDIENLTAGEFLKNMANGMYPNPDDLARVWRKLLETNPELRGKNYEERQKKGDIVTRNIHDL